MNSFLRQSTASQSRTTPPFLDDTDFKTAETGLTIANTDVKLLINGAASANKNSGGGTHRVNGCYSLTWDATDTATVGEIEVSIVVAGALPVFFKYWVLEEALYDALFAASANGFNASGLVTLAAVTHTGAVIPTVSTLTGHTAQTGDSFARIGATGSGLTSLATQASVNTIDDFLDTEIAAILAAVDTEIAAIITTLGTPAGASVSADIATRASQTSVNTIDDFLDTEIAAILEDTGTTLDDFLDTEIAAILADTNELQTDWVNGGRLDLLIDSIIAKTSQLTFTTANEVNANTRYVAGTQLQGTGTTGDEWGPA